MKRLLALFSIISILLTSSNINVFASDILIQINGESLYVDQSPIMYQDRVLLPMRVICEALDCEVTWNQETQTAQIQNPITIMAVQIGAGYISKIDRENQRYKQEIAIDVPAMIINDRTMLPVRAISEALHAVVNWNAAQNTVEITMEYDYIGDFHDGFAKVSKDGKYGMINENREEIVPVIYDNIPRYGFYDVDSGERHDSTAPVMKNGKWGLVDKTGKVVVPLEYDESFRIYGDLGMVKKNGKYGCVDKNGNVVIPLIYDDMVGGFAEGLAAVKKNGKYGFIDESGNTVIPFEYDYAYRFNTNEHKAIVEKNGEKFKINTKGEKVN